MPSNQPPAFGVLNHASPVMPGSHRIGLVRWVLPIALALGAAGFMTTAVLANPSVRETVSAAKASDVGAQYMAGMMHLFGQGTSQDIPTAVRWLQQSAQAGLPQAMVALAALYDVGQGVPFDADRATQLRKQAAAAGNSMARSQLEVDARLPGTRDYRRASVLADLKLYPLLFPYARTSAAAGSLEGQELLGRAYHFGWGVRADKAAALRLYEQAAAGGLTQAMRDAAYMYEFGEGVPVDRKKALSYYDRAATKGSTIARQAADNLRSPDYDSPRSVGTGGSGSQSNDFRQFQCIGAGGSWNGSSCYARDGSNATINP